MKIQYCSDLHLEFSENKNYLNKNPLIPVGDILLLAGDIVPFSIIEREKDFFNFCSDNFKYTYWIPGNHEYYGSDASFRSGRIKENIRNNVSLLNNEVVELDGVKLIFSTLWSQISSKSSWYIKKRLSDFHVIKYDTGRFTPNHYNKFHEDSLEFISKEISKKSKRKTIVVTHHVPTFMNYPEQYKGDTLNEAFATELFDKIENSNIDSWVYGHHHTNTPAFKISGTSMLTNQLGYLQNNEHTSFNREAMILL